MTRRRKQIAVSLLIITCLTFVARFLQPPLLFHNRDVFWYVTEDYPPLEYMGHREVEGVFDYRGPEVGPPSIGPIREWLRRCRLWPRWQPPPTQFGEIVLSDESGHELARMPGNGGIVNGNGAHAEMRLQASGSQLYVSWFFTLPRAVDRSRPVRFSTTFSINDLPPLPVQVTIPPPPVATSAPAQQ